MATPLEITVDQLTRRLALAEIRMGELESLRTQLAFELLIHSKAMDRLGGPELLRESEAEVRELLAQVEIDRADPTHPANLRIGAANEEG